MTSSATTSHTEDAAARSSRCRAAGLLSLGVAVLIAAVLQFAASAKVAHGADVLRRTKDAAVKVQHNLPTDFDVADYEWLVEPDAGLRGGVPLDFALGAGEFLLVVIVLVGYRTRAVWLLVPIVFASFFGYALQRTLHGLPCGCFGDLWHPPDGVSMALDAAFVALAFVITTMRRTHRSVLIATGVLSLAGLAGGYLYAATTMNHASPRSAQAPPAAAADRTADPGAAPATESDAEIADRLIPSFDPGMSAPEKLLASDLMKSVRDAHAAGEPTAYYVFIWDPTCTTCERLKPVVEEYKRQYEEEGNPFLQVLLFKKQDLRDALAIQHYEWDSSPFVFLVRDAEVVTLPGGDDAPLPDEILDELVSEQ